MSNLENKRIKLTITAKGIVKAFVALFVLLVAFGAFTEVKVSAATGVNVSVNYLDETATVTAGSGGSTKFYMSTDKKNWEILDSSGGVDLSGILKTKSVTVYFKGNKDTDAVSKVLDGEVSTLKTTYTIAAGVGTLSYSTTTSSAVQYRKGANGEWKTATGSISTAIYEVKGATLFFRTAATAATRAGKVVTVKIPKKPSAPSVRVDGSKLMITGLKAKETQYRLGDTSVWSTFLPTDTTSKVYELSYLLQSTAPSNTALPAGIIELQTLGTDKKLNSGVKIIEVAAQLTVPDTIAISGSAVTITDTDKTRAYEYTIVSQSGSLNLKTAKWTGISTNKAVIIPKVIIGDRVLIRLRSKTDSTTKQLILASTYKELSIAYITTKK